MDNLEIIKKKNNLMTKLRNKLRKDKYDEAIEIIEKFRRGDDNNVEDNIRQKYQQRGTRIEKDAERS